MFETVSGSINSHMCLGIKSAFMRFYTVKLSPYTHTHTFQTSALPCAPLTDRSPSYQQVSGAGCRRSSSDAAYELAESVRAQRECRLRPHYSDPMPADATKRKQLEMKIAAAARLHIHRRDRDSGKTLSTALRFAHSSCCKET